MYKTVLVVELLIEHFNHVFRDAIFDVFNLMNERRQITSQTLALWSEHCLKRRSYNLR